MSGWRWQPGLAWNRKNTDDSGIGAGVDQGLRLRDPVGGSVFNRCHRPSCREPKWYMFSLGFRTVFVGLSAGFRACVFEGDLACNQLGRTGSDEHVSHDGRPVYRRDVGQEEEDGLPPLPGRSTWQISGPGGPLPGASFVPIRSVVASSLVRRGRLRGTCATHLGRRFGRLVRTA